METKIFTKASLANNIHTEKKFFVAARFVSFYFTDL